MPSKGAQQTSRKTNPAEKYNILLFGETGSGKSTLINYLTNFFFNGKLCNLRIAIPTKHHQATEGWKYSEKDLHDPSKSKTSECTNYDFSKDRILFNFIDTPGLSDTEGTDKDDEHIKKIMTAAEEKGTLAAITIVINGTQARATVNLRNTLCLLKSSVPDILLENLIVILTNCSVGSANFDLQQLQPWTVPKENVFHMDNSALSKPMKDWVNDDDIREDLEHQWKKSMKTIDKLIQRLQQLGNKATDAFKQMRVKRNKIKSELHGILLEVKKLHDLQNELNCSNHAQQNISNDIQKYSNYKQTKQLNYVAMEDSDYHSTICADCNKVCHEDCSLEYTSTLGDGIFKRCACMNGKPNCEECGCGPSKHYHDKKKPVIKSKTVDDILFDVKAMYDHHMDKNNEIQSKISGLSADIASLKRALDVKEAAIENCCADLKKLCSQFNFVDELKSVIDIMERDARTLTTTEARTDADNRIKHFKEVANMLSGDK